MGFFDVLSGSDGADRARDTHRAQREYLTAGRDAALDESYAGQRTALGVLSPYNTGGGQQTNEADLLYRTAVGLNGLGKQSGYFDNFQNDPGFQAEVDYGLDQVQGSKAASGSLYSGRTLGALADRAQIHQRGAFQDRLGHLSRLSGQFQQNQQFQQGQSQRAAEQIAGYSTNASNRRGDLHFGTNQLIGNSFGGMNNAITDSRSAGLGNMLNLAGTVAGGFAGGSNSAASGLGRLFN